MKNQNLLIFEEIPDYLLPKFLIKRIGEDDIEISTEQRDKILKTLEAGTRFIQIDQFTLMLNSIKSIDPKWGKSNIPPRPKPRYIFDDETQNSVLINKKEINTWDYLYGDKIDDYCLYLKQIDKKNNTDNYFRFVELSINGEEPIIKQVKKNRQLLLDKYSKQLINIE